MCAVENRLKKYQTENVTKNRLQTQLLADRIIRIKFTIAAYSISEYSIGLIAFLGGILYDKAGIRQGVRHGKSAL